MDDFLTTAEAAEKLGLTIRAVQKMIESGRLKATRVGRDYIINTSSLNHIERRSLAGRPPKAKAETSKGSKKKGVRSD